MIINQLPTLASVNSTDEIPIERGTTSYKTPIANVYAPGGTMEGLLYVKSTNLTSGTTVGSSTSGNAVAYTDSAGAVIGTIRPVFQTDSKQGIRIQVSRSIGGSTKSNAVTLYIDSSDNHTVIFTDASAWLTGLGLNTVTTETTVGNIASASSPFSITAASFSNVGKLAMVYLTVKGGTSAISGDATSTQVATLNSGKRPPSRAAAVVVNGTTSTSVQPTKAYINSNGAVYIIGSVAASQTFYVMATYILA